MTAVLSEPALSTPAVPKAPRAGMRVLREAAVGAGRGIRRILAPLARRARVISGFGWGVLVAAAAALALAVTFGWTEMLTIAAMGAAAVVLAIPFVLGRTAYRVRVEMAASRVVVGDPAVGRVVVRNVARRTAPAMRVELPVGRVRAEFRMPRLAAEQEHDELFQIPTQRRAVLQLGPVSSVRADPLGLLRREVGWTDATELFVHPRTVTLAGETSGLLRDLEGLPTRDLADDDVSFHALREYTPGDDLRYVHWKSTARTQKLMIRQFEQTRRSHLVVALSTAAGEYADADEFELAVSIAGSIGVTALREGKNVSVVTGTGRLAAPTPNQLLDRLSAVEASPATAGAEAIARAIAKTAPGASVVIFVTGSALSMGALRGASARVPVTARCAAVRAVVGGELARRAIGDLVGVDVPELGSLRMAMRAVAA